MFAGSCHRDRKADYTWLRSMAWHARDGLYVHLNKAAAWQQPWRHVGRGLLYASQSFQKKPESGWISAARYDGVTVAMGHDVKGQWDEVRKDEFWCPIETYINTLPQGALPYNRTWKERKMMPTAKGQLLRFLSFPVSMSLRHNHKCSP